MTPLLTIHKGRACVVATCLVAIMFTGVVAVSFGQRTDSRRAGTTGSVPGALPPFFLIDGWEATAVQAEHTSAQEPLSYAVERLCRLYHTQFDPKSIMRENRSPLEWPDVFGHDLPNATRQRIELRALLDANGLVYRELIPLDLTARALADSIAASIASDHPALLNAADAPVVYGYDRRELDQWWWFDLAGAPEIVLESERKVRFTVWSDDPAAGVAWIVTGAGDFYPRNPDSLDWTFLGRLNASVQGLAEEGIEAYPLTLRRFRDMLAATDSMLSLKSPEAIDDPLGILRARAARNSLVNILQGVASRSRDSGQSEPMRLAEYHMHGAIATLSELASLLYGTPPKVIAIETPLMNSSNLQVKTRVLQLMTDLLKSEKLAMESLSSAVATHEKVRETRPPERPNRRRR